MSFKIQIQNNLTFQVYDENNVLIPQNALTILEPIINDRWIFINPVPASPTDSIETTTRFMVYEGWNPMFPQVPIVSTPPPIEIDDSWDENPIDLTQETDLEIEDLPFNILENEEPKESEETEEPKESEETEEQKKN